MAARRTRAAARRAALVPFLSELSDDEIEAIGYALADPLAPRLAVALSSCSRGLRRALAAGSALEGAQGAAAEGGGAVRVREQAVRSVDLRRAVR